MASTTSRDEENVRSIRELGGEIFAEITYRFGEDELNWELRDELVDVIMGVLARHVGKKLRNDPDLPVTPLG